MTDRDWTHPQAGGTGAVLRAKVGRWLDWGHRVTIVACGYEGAVRHERDGRLEIHRLGGRSTVFPRAILAQWRGLVPDPDVVLEVINGITFLTPLWLRTPRLVYLQHIHREHYVEEMGRKGRLAGWLLETLPLRALYRDVRFSVISEDTAREVADGHGIPREHVHVNYLGVDAEELGPPRRSPEPTLLYLGRLKRYKRVEWLLDTLREIPEATLDIAGDGDWRGEIERAVRESGVGDRVRMHGFVSEERKRELLRSAWVNLNASAAEGFCFEVLEAAASGTPTVALRVGGLPEAVAHGRTGFIADTREELTEYAKRLVREPELRERMGAAALERAREFNWDACAQRDLELMRAEIARAEFEPGGSPLRRLLRSDTARAAGLAGAVMASNVVALVFTIAFARILGAQGYGSLAALLSSFLILSVPGNALQIAVAREVSAALADGDRAPGAGVRRWLRTLVLASVASVGVSILLREPIATLIGVDEVPWAAAAAIPTGCLWLVLSVERGALQGFQRYRTVGLSVVGEACARLLFGLLLVALGLDVTGAFLGTGLSIAAVGLALALPLHGELLGAERRHGTGAEWRLRELFGLAWVPVAALALIAVLQNVDVIVVRHNASHDAAGAYAAASVAAKVVIWVAVGLGMYLLPEAARRTRGGLDARPILVRTLALIALTALPLVAIYALAAGPLLGAVFGERFRLASGALPWLGIAMALLACAYLSVQYLLALHRASFLWLLGLAAVAEPLMLQGIGARLTSVALGLLALQLVLAACVAAMVFRSAAQPRRAVARQAA